MRVFGLDWSGLLGTPLLWMVFEAPIAQHILRQNRNVFSCSVLRVCALLWSWFTIPAVCPGLPATSLGFRRSFVWGGLGFALLCFGPST